MRTTPNAILQMSRGQQLAWAGGLFEGEGCFTPAHGSPKSGARYSYPRAILAMADEDVVNTFYQVVNCLGHIRTEIRAPNRLDLYRWEVQARSEFDQFISLISPYLSDRRLAALQQMVASATPRQKVSWTRA